MRIGWDTWLNVVLILDRRELVAGRRTPIIGGIRITRGVRRVLGLISKFTALGSVHRGSSVLSDSYISVDNVNGTEVVLTPPSDDIRLRFRLSSSDPD